MAWFILTLLLIPLAAGSSSTQSAMLLFSWAILVGVASAAGFVLGGVRQKKISIGEETSIDGKGPTYRLRLTLLRGGLVGLPIGALGAIVLIQSGPTWPSWTRPLILVTTAIVVVQLTARLPRPSNLAPKKLTQRRHALETALPTALLAAPFGTVLLWTRLPLSARGPDYLAHHFALSVLLYAGFLAIAGFVKAWTETTWGLIEVERQHRQPPHPLVLGSALAAVIWFLPGLQSISDLAALALKLVAGFFVALLFTAVGALRGQEMAWRNGRR